MTDKAGSTEGSAHAGLVDQVKDLFILVTVGFKQRSKIIKCMWGRSTLHFNAM